MLSIQNLQAGYGQSVVIPDMSFSASQGQILGIVGRNGMGKSTLFRTLIGMIPAMSGQITLNDKNITGMPSHKRVAQGVAFVPQGRMIFPYLSVYENLISGVSGRPATDAVEEIYSLFPVLQEMCNRKGGNLSGGQQQQLAIGRALMTNPSLLILDEATEGLAPVVRQEIWTAIATLKQTTNLSIIVVDKTISELRQIADKVVILERGKSVWTGGIDALTSDLKDQYLGV